VHSLEGQAAGRDPGLGISYWASRYEGAYIRSASLLPGRDGKERQQSYSCQARIDGIQLDCGACWIQ